MVDWNESDSETESEEDLTPDTIAEKKHPNHRIPVPELHRRNNHPWLETVPGLCLVPTDVTFQKASNLLSDGRIVHSKLRGWDKLIVAGGVGNLNRPYQLHNFDILVYFIENIDESKCHVIYYSKEDIQSNAKNCHPEATLCVLRDFKVHIGLVRSCAAKAVREGRDDIVAEMDKEMAVRHPDEGDDARILKDYRDWIETLKRESRKDATPPVASTHSDTSDSDSDSDSSSLDVPLRKLKKTKTDKHNYSRLGQQTPRVPEAAQNLSEEEAACYLCHCGVDCSDRALFFPKDREKGIQESRENDQEYYIGMDDPYLPGEMYDAHNSLVYCDSCDRTYHQKCHFVPILRLPRGDWNCLICTIQQRANHNVSQICLPVQHDPKTFFASPPNPSFALAERQFEFDSKREKAKLWQRQLKRVKTFLRSQVSNIRLATTALDTLTSTKGNRAVILSNQHKSKELAQTLLRVTTAKYKIRQTLQSLESLRVSPCTNSLDPTMIQNWCQRHPESSCHVVPHGIDYFLNHRRVTPNSIFSKMGEINVTDLQCCICMDGDSTDDNDVILCDGQGCYRAFHMKCIHPEIKPQDLEKDDEDWFCPLCTATSSYTHGIYHTLRDGGGEEDDSNDDEEEEEKDDEDEWDTPDDAFPTSQWEYEAAVKLSQGKQDEDTNELLALYLGDEYQDWIETRKRESRKDTTPRVASVHSNTSDSDSDSSSLDVPLRKLKKTKTDKHINQQKKQLQAAQNLPEEEAACYLGFELPGPTVIYCDNQSTIKMINSSIPTERSRHICVQWFAVQDWKEQGHIVLDYIPGIINDADDLT